MESEPKGPRPFSEGNEPNPATGISEDFMNETNVFGNEPDFVDKGIRKEADVLGRIARDLRERPLRHYEERFPSEKWTGVVIPENEEQVQKINALVDQINSTMINPAAFTIEDVKRVLNEMHQLVYGNTLEEAREISRKQRQEQGL